MQRNVTPAVFARPPGAQQVAIHAADGTALFHRDWGGHGPPVVFLASWSLPLRLLGVLDARAVGGRAALRRLRPPRPRTFGRSGRRL